MSTSWRILYEALPISELPFICWRSTFSSLKAKWITGGLCHHRLISKKSIHDISPTKSNVSNNKTKLINPAEVGSTHFWDMTKIDFDDGGKQILFSETRYCAGRNKCNSLLPRTNSRGYCPCKWKWTIYQNTPTEAKVEICGDHGDSFIPEAAYNSLPTLVLHQIEPKLQLGASPHEILTELKSTPILQNFGASGVVALTLERVADLKGNWTKKKLKGKSDPELVDQFLKNPQLHQQFIVYPSEGESVDPDKDWIIVITNQTLLDSLYKHGKKIIGLDGVFKFVKYRYPLWILVCQDSETGEGITCAFAVANANTPANIAKFLSFIQDQVWKNVAEDWDPIVMIDKDPSESLACAQLGLRYILCNFHVSVTLLQRMNQYCKRVENRAILWACKSHSKK